MSKSTTTPNRERLHTLNNTEETIKENYPLIETEELKNTPFTLVKQNDKYFLTAGQYKVTEESDSREETIGKLLTEKWQLIVALTVISTTRAIQLQEQKNNFSKTMPEIRADQMNKAIEGNPNDHM